VLTRVAAAGALAAIAGAAVTAEAQYSGRRAESGVGEPPRTAIWADLGFHHGDFFEDARFVDATATVVSPELGAYFRVAENVEGGARWGFAFGTADLDGPLGDEHESAFMVGNPYLEGLYHARVSDVTLRLGGGVTIPVASVDDDPGFESFAQAGTLWVAGAMRGAWDAWQWARDRFTVVIPRLRLDSGERDLVWAVEGATGIMAYTGEGDGREAEIVAQGAVEAGVRLGRAVQIGARFQAVWIATGSEGLYTQPDEEEDDLQLALAPFFRLQSDGPFFFARVLLNLDEPLGFAFDRDGFWGLSLGGGTHF